MQTTVSKRHTHMGWSLQKPRTLTGVSQDMMCNSSSKKLWQHGHLGSSPETQWLLRASHVVPSGWYVPKITSLRRKAGVQYKTHCSYTQFWHSYQFWQWWEPSSNPGSHTPVNGQTSKWVILRTAVSGLLLTLFLCRIQVY